MINKKTLWRLFAILPFVLLLLSCKRDVQKTNDVLTFDFKQEPCASPFDVLETTFIKLETNDNCLIDKTVVQTESALGKIFILTGGARTLLVFDRSGKFITLVGNRGGGPGEYIVPMSFSIDHRKNVITVIDLAQKKLLDYDLTDYRFIAERKAEYDNFCFEYLGDDKIVWKNTDYNSDYANWSFIVTDREQKYINGHLEKDFITGYSTGHTKNIYQLREEVFAYTQYHPVIYRFREDTVVPFCRLNFGKYKLPPLDYLKKISENDENFLPELNRSDYVAYYTIFDAGETFTVFYSVSETPYIGIYDKRNSRTYAYTQEEFQDKLKIGRIDWFSGTVDDYVVAALQPSDLLQQKNDNYTFHPELQKIVDTSVEDDNPILILMKVKNY
ncbi:MAG: 6-bladed beta-propeller [Tannerella sp.]|jgi:hypothetical protein|nr:6-bladed beta-propeller [Tannerella sp.]